MIVKISGNGHTCYIEADEVSVHRNLCIEDKKIHKYIEPSQDERFKEKVGGVISVIGSEYTDSNIGDFILLEVFKYTSKSESLEFIQLPSIESIHIAHDSI